MKRTIITAAILAATAMPALAADATQQAINHFNLSADSRSDLIAAGPNGPVLGTTVSTRGDEAIAVAVRNYNASVDRAAERIDLNSVTVFSGEPAYGAEIFDELRRADDSN
ncbi:hypothetical protein P6F26_00330 [Roseibacterium sp. SDUM158017]|uniref:hypothetical protein n=1 Tax=Roseicyclus salinarum TaxID=3036773 RepID=UPI0024157223|nr:hypothetical protein [Roseibacterium sp. SDUM158017]MDG4646875.1 hypothetical protein [Roseibacterium sp. SDUM158017]